MRTIIDEWDNTQDYPKGSTRLRIVGVVDERSPDPEFPQLRLEALMPDGEWEPWVTRMVGGEMVDFSDYPLKLRIRDLIAAMPK